MNNEEYKKLYKFEQFYWWHVGRRFILKSFLERFLKNKKNKILEFGCGTGGNLKFLSDFGEVMGLDISERALNFCKKRGFNNLVLGDVESLNLPENSFDLVLALDVLEHLKDDKGTIEKAWRVLKTGGYFLVTVPAYQFLWSEHDKALNHYRRYLARDFSNKLEEMGFRVIKKSYLISFGFPLVLAYRIFRKIIFPKGKENIAYVILPKPINDFFIFLLKREASLLKYLNLPFGTSIICLAQKIKSNSI